MIQKEKELLPYNTFGFAYKAKYFAEVDTIDALKEILQDPTYKDIPLLVLGGGSNILFTKDFDGLVLKINIKGISKLKQEGDQVFIEAGAGEIWHDLVLHSLKENWAGLENLSLIPGTVGAAPMQNIGAYGVEVKHVFDSLQALHIPTLEIHHFDAEKCAFGYRESVFKKDLKGQYIILKVTFCLAITPTFHVDYGSIRETIEEMQEELTIQSVSDAVVKIRTSKLPDPKKIGNAGSFFKNPIVSEALAKSIKEKYPNMPQYPAPTGIKLAAGWLIDQCGWKGKRLGNIGVHPHQALVLVHYGGAKGEAIVQLSNEIQNSVKEKFGVEINPEVNFV